MSLHVSLIDDRAAYDGFLATLKGDEHLTFYHSWEWGELMAEERPKFVRVAIRNGDDIIAVGQVGLHIDRRVPLLRWWYCPRGLAMDYADPARVTEAYRVLRDFFRDKSDTAFLRVDPNLVQGDPAEAAIDVLRPKRAAVFVQVERCWITEIKPTEEEQFAWMREHGMISRVKRATAKARKAGVTVRVSDDPADIDILIGMLHELNDRKGGIGLHPDEHYVRQFRKLAPAGTEKLVIAELDGKVGAINLLAVYGGESSYLHGASSKDELFRPLSPATLAHVEAMRWLAENRPEVTRYNFWGIISDENRATGTHPRHGYSEFKRGFGGYKVEYMRARDFVYKPLLRAASYELDARRTRRSQND